MKRFIPLLLLFLIAGFSKGASVMDTFVAVSRTNWIPKAMGVPQFDTNRVITNVTWFTNMEASYEFEVRTNIVAAIESAGKLARESGWDIGEIIGYLLLAILGALAKWESMRRKKLNTVLGQNIETYSEVVKALPNGEAIDRKAKTEIASQQVEADVKKMAAEVHEEKVNPAAAKESADKVMKL